MPIMRSLIRIAAKAARYPFTRVARKTKLKKGGEKKAVTAKKINKEEELAAEEANKKEVNRNEAKTDNASKGGEDESIDEETLKQMLAAAPRDEVLVNASGLEVVLRGHEYKVRLTKPANGAKVLELQTALTRNRDLLEKSTENLYRLHCGNIAKNKEHNAFVEAIEKGNVKPENDKMKEAFAKLVEMGKVDLNAWDEKFLRPGIQNALVARANIDLLIPLINMRGGEAEYKGLEALPINDHINILRDNAAKQAAEDEIPPPEPEKTDEWTIQEFLTAAVIVIIIALLLRAFI